MNIQAFAERMAPLRDGCYSCTAQEITRLTKDLYADSKESIEAVSLIDLREYWAHPALGSAAIDLNRDASLQKIQIQRIFVVQRKEELIAYADLLKAVQDNGVRLRYITLADAPESCRVDFAIYDRNKYVQYFEFEESTYNKRYSRCSISIQEPVVSKYRGIFDRLVRLSIPFDAAKFEIPTGESHSLWSSGAFRDHYQGAAPELHLATIQQRYSTVLDVGCGAGRILGLFADMGCQVTGIESDPTALAMCRRRVAGNPRVRLLNEQFGRTSLPGEKFDLVIAYNSIYHARRDEMFETLKRIAELVVPGGHV
jgi:2-polyprenyl-3-methyl-5-hydroxy-6-metoxy-1,4-benzoquinol methylase